MFYDFGKRILDIFSSVLGLILFSPLMLLTALWIKIISPSGPVFADTPKRVGHQENLFRMFKFRSMIPNAHKWFEDHPEYYEQYKANNYKLDPDPRVIKGGQFMRKYSIDELPQFINVFLGQMSIVGPRAYYPFELEDQEKKFPESSKDIKMALTVKPGITGTWQVSGRSKIGFADRVRLDAEYASKRSLLYDLLVILKTPYVVITKKGAY